MGLEKTNKKDVTLQLYLVYHSHFHSGHSFLSLSLPLRLCLFISFTNFSFFFFFLKYIFQYFFFLFSLSLCYFSFEKEWRSENSFWIKHCFGMFLGISCLLEQARNNPDFFLFLLFVQVKFVYGLFHHPVMFDWPEIDSLFGITLSPTNETILNHNKKQKKTSSSSNFFLSLFPSLNKIYFQFRLFCRDRQEKLKMFQNYLFEPKLKHKRDSEK